MRIQDAEIVFGRKFLSWSLGLENEFVQALEPSDLDDFNAVDLGLRRDRYLSIVCRDALRQKGYGNFLDRDVNKQT